MLCIPGASTQFYDRAWRRRFEARLNVISYMLSTFNIPLLIPPLIECYKGVRFCGQQMYEVPTGTYGVRLVQFSFMTGIVQYNRIALERRLVISRRFIAWNLRASTERFTLGWICDTWVMSCTFSTFSHTTFTFVLNSCVEKLFWTSLFFVF